MTVHFLFLGMASVTSTIVIKDSKQIDGFLESENFMIFMVCNVNVLNATELYTLKW